MLYHLLYPLRDIFSPFNIFQYITFRSAAAAILALVFSFLMGPWIIRLLNKLQIGEEIRHDGPESHKSKRGTPTMGGLMIIGSVLIPTLLLTNLTNVYIQIVVISLVWMGIIGFLDDYLKVVKKMKKGLVARYKLVGQIMLGVLVSAWILNHPTFAEFSTVTNVPFFKNLQLDFGHYFGYHRNIQCCESHRWSGWSGSRSTGNMFLCICSHRLYKRPS